MCQRYRRTVPAIGVCLLSGMVQGSACSWIPPEIVLAPADTTVLGAVTDLVPVSMWPGESRRIPLPAVVPGPRTRLQYELRGTRVGFSLSEESPVYLPVVRGLILTAGAPATGVVVTGPPPPRAGLAPSFCVVRVDTLAIPGDTLSAWYTISTQTRPPRQSGWRIRIAVTAKPTILSTRAAQVHAFKVHPNPCNPSTTVSFRAAGPTAVTLQVFDAQGRVIVRIEERVTGYKTHSVTWNGTDAHGRTVASGVYLIRLRAGDQVYTRKVIVLK